MLKTGELAEVEYYWNHPQMGKIFVRCSGKVYEREGQIYRIRGYYQDITELVRLRKTNLVQGPVSYTHLSGAQGGEEARLLKGIPLQLSLIHI